MPELRSTTLSGIDELYPVIHGTEVLARGARGPAIKAVQRGLLALGYALNGGADGIFGASTELALRSLRELHDLPGAAFLDAIALERLDASLVRLESVATHALANPRFAGDDQLARVLSGRSPLPSRGSAVRAVQQALLDLLFTLPRYGADGSIGKETQEAVRQFQRWQRIRPGGEVSALTLMALDQAAPGLGQQATRHPEYATLVRDGQLTVTVGIGYDEGDYDLVEISQLVQGLRSAGFVQTGSTAADAVHTFTRALAIPGHAGTMRVRVVTRHTRRPESEFAEGLVHDAVTIYAGHARYGTGPDFDAKESTAENFVIGLGAPQHVTGAMEPGYDPHMNQILRGIPNDLLARRFDPQRDQLWMFAGCTTRHYLQELRGLVGGKNTRNLDLVVSTRPIYWRDMGTYPLDAIKGLVQGETINQILRRLCATATATEAALNAVHPGDAFMIDGFGDNGPT
jgi:peptidoglycan hydrolase-like protein with peptidoglycan-binding domain